MQMMPWSNNYSVGIASIDDQHKKLVAIINELGDAMKVGKGKEQMGRVLDELVTYTQRHFAHEEQLFKLHAYPMATEHKTEHDRLIADVGEKKKKFAAGQLPTVELLEFLRAWLVNHIQKSDKAYQPHLAAKGVK